MYRYDEGSHASQDRYKVLKNSAFASMYRVFIFSSFRILTTNSGSPSRRRPSSMKTATSLSPTALWTRYVATVLSTPPEQAEITLLSPTESAISFRDVLMNFLALNMFSSPVCFIGMFGFAF